MKANNLFPVLALLCFFLMNNQNLNAQYSKQILIKSIESYVLLNYNHLYEIYVKEKPVMFDSVFVDVDTIYFCIEGYKKQTQNKKTILCLYEGENNEMYDFIFGDLNNDGLMDAIVTFSLEGFDGGNGRGRFHATLIGDGTKVYISNVFYYYPPIDFDSINKGIIYGSQLGYDNGDGHCCPSLIRDVIYQLDSNRFKLVKQFEYIKREN